MKRVIAILAGIAVVLIAGCFYLVSALKTDPQRANQYILGKLKSQYGIEIDEEDVLSSSFNEYTSRDLAWSGEYHLNDAYSTQLEKTMLEDDGWEKTTEHEEMREYLSSGAPDEILDDMQQCFEERDSRVRLTLYDGTDDLRGYSICVANAKTNELYYFELQ